MRPRKVDRSTDLRLTPKRCRPAVTNCTSSLSMKLIFRSRKMSFKHGAALGALGALIEVLDAPQDPGGGLNSGRFGSNSRYSDQAFMRDDGRYFLLLPRLHSPSCLGNSTAPRRAALWSDSLRLFRRLFFSGVQNSCINSSSVTGVSTCGFSPLSGSSSREGFPSPWEAKTASLRIAV